MPIDIGVFSDRLRDVISWTNFLSKGFDFENGNYGTVFRQTNPIVEGREAFNIDFDYTTWNIDDYSLDNYKTLLAFALSVRNKHDEIKEDLHLLGRILCFETSVSTHDGAAIVGSNCFLDESDVPPIDTWFYLEEFRSVDMRPILYCWIPKGFEPVMEEGIAVEILDSYRWLDEKNPQLYNVLNKGGKWD